MFTRKFMEDLAERVISSAAGGALAAITTTTTLGDHHDISWAAVGVSAGVTALVSLLKGLAASRVGRADSASLVE